MTLDEATADLTSWRVLPGVSGASVILGTVDEHNWFVRKVARTPEMNARLARQAAKQDRFAAAQTGALRSPPVLREGETAGRYFFEMPMVIGVDGATFLRRASYVDVVRLADELVAYLQDAAASTPCDVQASSLAVALDAKLGEVRVRSPLLDDSLYERLEVAVRVVRDLGEVRPTWCHGDLTLENLIVDADGTIWVVDLLDAPFEHYWHDVAKLHQDLDGGWYLRHGPPIAAGVRHYLSRRLLDGAREIDPMYETVHAPLVAMTFVRILPYVSGAEAEFVRDRISYYAEIAGRGGQG